MRNTSKSMCIARKSVAFVRWTAGYAHFPRTSPCLPPHFRYAWARTSVIRHATLIRSKAMINRILFALVGEEFSEFPRGSLVFSFLILDGSILWHCIAARVNNSVSFRSWRRLIVQFAAAKCDAPLIAPLNRVTNVLKRGDEWIIVFRYTRNLVDEGNGRFNLMVLCWGEGHGSAIHDHANAHCIMKILQGELCEVPKVLWIWELVLLRIATRANSLFIADASLRMIPFCRHDTRGPWRLVLTTRRTNQKNSRNWIEPVSTLMKYATSMVNRCY